ncbi:T9SS type A sorting domain-containing protein [Bacteroidota bacterium]
MIKQLLTIFLLIVSISVFSQISINQSDMPDVDDTIRTSKTAITSVDYTLTGANYNWDFSSLFPVTQGVDTFVSIWSTPLVYNVVFLYPFVSTIAKEQPDNTTIPGFQFTDFFDFYKETSSYYALVGYGAKINSIPIPVKYDNPDNLYHFPVTYGTVDSSESAFGQAIPGIGYFGESKKRVNHVDGWGTLTTPYGTFQTIRIKSQINTFDTLHLDSLGFGFGIPRNITEYKWLAKGFGLPVLNISVSGIITNISYIDSVRNITLGIADSDQDQNKVIIFPNPSKEFVTLDFSQIKSSEINISFYNALGGLLDTFSEKISSDNYKKMIDLSSYNLTKGIYFIRIDTEQNVITEPLIIK